MESSLLLEPTNSIHEMESPLLLEPHQLQKAERNLWLKFKLTCAHSSKTQRINKKANEESVKKNYKENAIITKQLEIADKVYITTGRQAFVTLKDRKENYRNNP